MRKELEYAKEVALIAKLYRSELLSEKEYEKIMCSLVGNEAGEMCSPASLPTQMGIGILSAGIFLVTALLTWELGKRFVGVTKKFSRWLAGLYQKRRGVRA